MHPDVQQALQKLEATQSPDRLTLEEVMMCRYEKPCRRISPGSDVSFQKYARGSILIYESEIVLILFPEDDTTYFQYQRYKSIGQKRMYQGLLPGSSFYTTGGSRVRVEEANDVRGIREAMREHEVWKAAHPSRAHLLSADNSAGSLNMHRCSETFSLAGRLEGARLKRLFKEGHFA